MFKHAVFALLLATLRLVASQDFKLHHVGTDKCLGFEGSEDGSVAIVQDCVSDDSPKFQFVKSTFQLKVTTTDATGKCLDGGSNPLTLEQCNLNFDEQQWLPTKVQCPHQRIHEGHHPEPVFAFSNAYRCGQIEVVGQEFWLESGDILKEDKWFTGPTTDCFGM